MNALRLQRINETVNGVEYMAKYVSSFQRVGNLYKACCPFHHEKTPSFTIYPRGHTNSHGIQENTSFYCFGCEAYGANIVDFVALLNNISKDEALLQLEHEFNLAITDDEIINFLQNEYQLVKNRKLTILPAEDTKMLISVICRKYLQYCYQFNTYEHEKKLIDKYFYWLDKYIGNLNDIEIFALYEKLKNKLQLRKQKVCI